MGTPSQIPKLKVKRENADYDKATWWCNDMDTLSALLVIIEGNWSPHIDSVMWICVIFFIVNLNNLLNKLSIYWIVVTSTHWSLGELGVISGMQFSTLFFILVCSDFFDNVFSWMPWYLTDDKSVLVQLMAWCRQATSHYLSQCWPRSMSPYGVTRP